MKSLDGKIAFVTGAAMGNGEGIAQAMAEKGATVIVADIDEKIFETASKIIGSVIPYILDVRDFQKVNDVAKEVLEKYKRVDIVVNNAGVARMIKIEDMDDKLRDFHYDVNVVGAWNVTKAFINSMIERRYGRIINMSSVTGPKVVDPGMMGYAMSKGAILAFTKAIAIDVAKYGITANAILPGYFLTPMVRHSAHETNPQNPQKVLDKISATIPLGRFGNPKEIGYLAAFLASDEAAYITGTEFLIDGGSTLPETGAMGVVE